MPFCAAFFSHLSNIAEDVGAARGRHAVREPRRGSIAAAVAELRDDGVKSGAVESWFANAVISPVVSCPCLLCRRCVDVAHMVSGLTCVQLTAHPTEVKRKSILDGEHEIFRLLQQGSPAGAGAGGEHEAELYREILGLWQTALLRPSKLSVHDEIENGTDVCECGIARCPPVRTRPQCTLSRPSHPERVSSPSVIPRHRSPPAH